MRSFSAVDVDPLYVGNAAILRAVASALDSANCVATRVWRQRCSSLRKRLSRCLLWSAPGWAAGAGVGLVARA